MPDLTTTTKYFRLDRRDLAYLTFILESYEGLATLSTVDKSETVVSVTTVAGLWRDVDDLIAALQQEILLHETAPPDAGAGGSHA